MCWCKCFTPTEEDLLAASTEWPCSHDKSYGGDDYAKSQKSTPTKTYSEDEDVILSQVYSKSYKKLNFFFNLLLIIINIIK